MTHDQLILDLIGRGETRDELHELIRIGFRNGLPGYFDPKQPGDLEELLRDMEGRRLLRRDGWEWRPRGPKVEARLF